MQPQPDTAPPLAEERDPSDPGARASAALAACVRRFRDGLRSARAHWASHAPLLFVCACLVALGCGLRYYDLGFPEHVTFDERHYVVNGRNYLSGLPDDNNHPPLGKLLIAFGMLVWGDNSFGWRIMPLLLGVGNVVLAYFLGRTAFRSAVVGWLAAAFVAADGFLVSYSRMAHLDGMLTFFALACGLAVLRTRSSLRIMVGAALVGCAACVKLSGTALLLGVTFAIFAQANVRRNVMLVLAAALTAVAVYWAFCAVGLAATKQDWGIVDVWSRTTGQVAFHGEKTSFEHGVASRWYTWPLPLRPVPLRQSPGGEFTFRPLSSMGNPLLWWSSSLLSMCVAVWVLWRGPRELLRRERASREPTETGFLLPHSYSLAQLVVFWGAMLLPWVVSFRASYIWHYMPSYAFGLILLAGLVGWIYERRAWLGLVAVLLVGEVTVFYAPLWGQLPITVEAYRQRMFLKSWR